MTTTAAPATNSPRQADCKYCNRYDYACGRHDAPATSAPAPEHIYNLRSQYAPASTPVMDLPGWITRHDWAVALTERDSRLTAQDYSTLITAIVLQMPVVLTTRSYLDGREYHETATVMVSDLHVEGEASRIQTQAWGGFNTTHHLGEIVSVTVPERQLTPAN